MHDTAGGRRLASHVTAASWHDVLLPEEGITVSIELIQTLVNAALLLVVPRAGVRTDIAELRTELKGDIAELRGEQAQMRSDLTIVALAVGARPDRGSS